MATRKKMTLKETSGETLVCLGGDGLSGHREAICQIYPEEELRPSRIQQVEDFDSMVRLIAANQGITLLPHALDLTKKGVVIIPIVGTKVDLDFQMWAIWQRHLPSRHIKHFVQLLEERVNGQTSKKPADPAV